ncbi:MAG TPA: DUF5655 domain-containing protein [Geothrix sp.]|nr:DUF5655 domain-containing protein [Geothrix sp.]
MTLPWTCPACHRRFTRPNQRHACGTGEGEDVLQGRPPAMVTLYAAIETFAKSFGPVEFVTRERYVLMRSHRIFADLVVMKDTLRLAIHLPREVAHPLFIKVGRDRRHVSHIAKIRTEAEFDALKPFLREAYEFSLTKPAARPEPSA